MKDKKWFRQYGIHIVICAVVIGIAFGVNQKINLDRSRVYSVSNANVLEKITDFEVVNGKYIFKGWAFDPENYSENVKCELILHDVAIGEDIWTKMLQNPEIQVIEDRYADGADYSAGSYKAEVSERKVDPEQVYEILLRYTTEIPVTEETELVEKKQEYVVTIRTNEFLHNGEVTEYNPKTFVAPEIAGTVLEKELEGARLFHYFEEGMWVYVNKGKMYYILDSIKFPVENYPNGYMAVNWFATNLDKIPEDYQQYGGGNADFDFMAYHVTDLDVGNYKVAVRDIPSQYATIMNVRFYDRDTKTAIYGISKQIEEN